jgi:hypothetical protein
VLLICLFFDFDFRFTFIFTFHFIFKDSRTPISYLPSREDDSFYLASIFSVNLLHLVSFVGGKAEGKEGQRLSKWRNNHSSQL